MGPQMSVVDDYGGDGGVDNANRGPTEDLLRRYREEHHFPMFEQYILKSPLPFEDLSIDAVTCFHCLEHWYDSPKRLFLDIFRMLKPDGMLTYTSLCANRRRLSTIWLFSVRQR